MIQAVYNRLLSCYSPKQTPASNITHKRSELRRIYNSIVKVNKRSPLYSINMSDDTQLFAISLKEASIEVNNILSSFLQPEKNAFNSVNVQSSNNETASVKLIGDKDSDLPEPFTLEIKALARPQINASIEVPKQGYRPKSGSYSFIADVEGEQFEFQFKLNADDDNQNILTKLSDFINKANIGLNASIHNVDQKHLQLRIISAQTGDIGEPLFTLRDINSPKEQIGLVDYYGLNNIVQDSTNNHFTIDGEAKEASNNQIILNHRIQLNLQDITDEPVEISYIPNNESILSVVKQFTDSYNSVIKLARNYPSNQGMAGKLIQEVRSVLSPYRNELEACGIQWNEKKQLYIDESLAKQAIEYGDMKELFTSEELIPDLMKKFTYITVNPIDYVDKTLVTYPNFQRPGVNSAYIGALYSGLLFNYYC